MERDYSLEGIAYPALPPEKIPADRLIAFDFETYGLDDLRPVLVSFAWFLSDEEKADPEVIKFYNSDRFGSVVYDLKKADSLFIKRILHAVTKAKRLIGHNILFELKVLYTIGYDPLSICDKIEDSMAVAYVLDTERSVSLASLAAEVGMQKMDWKEASQESDEVYREYNRNDSFVSLAVYEKFYPELEKNKCDGAYLLEIMNIKPVLAAWINGVFVDIKKLEEMDKYLKEEERRLTELICDITGKVFNPKSHRQLEELIYNEWKIPVNTTFISEKGKKRTDKNALSDLIGRADLTEQQAKFFEALNRFSEITKLGSTYTSDSFRNRIMPNGRIRMNMNPFGTATGRASSSNPNLQNIPARGFGGEIRGFFAAEKGKKLIIADYKQAEYRLFAHFTGDSRFTDAYRKDPLMDVHGFMGDLLSVSRDTAKTLNFAILYGATAFSVNNTLRKSGVYLSMEETGKLFEKYFDTFPSVKKFAESAFAVAAYKGYVRTLSGKRRVLTPYVNNIGRFRRIAVNTIVQGGVADIVKMAQIKIINSLGNDDIKFLMQVHDELVFEVDENKAEEYAAEIKHIMENVYPMSVPFISEPQIADNWKEGK